MKPIRIVLLATWLCVGSMGATTYFVDVLNNGYSPSSIEVNVGDTVIWTNQDDDDDSHTVTSDTGEWIGGLLIGFGDQFSHTFNNLGSFSYRDSFDGFTGTVNVVDATPPMEITLSAISRKGENIEFEISGLTVGYTHIVQTSTNLSDWTGLSTNVATATTVGFTNVIGSHAVRFFRVVQLD